jgi:transposase-like protein
MSPSESRRIHIEAWQTSGMSQAAYCREHGLNTRTFGNWVRKHRAGQVIRSPELVPVTIKPMPVPANTLRLCWSQGDHVLELPSTVSPVDMRRGIDGLSTLVIQALQRSPCAGSAFVFCNRIKVRYADFQGVRSFIK